MPNIQVEDKKRRNKWILILSLLLLSLIVVAAAILIPIAITLKSPEENVAVSDLKFERVNPVFEYEEDILNSKIIVVYENQTQTSINLKEAINNLDEYQLKLVGTHEITLSYKNFTKKLTVTINPMEFSENEISKISYNDHSVEYNENGYFFPVTQIPEGSTIKYFVNEISGNGNDQYLIFGPGEYLIIALIEKPNYKSIQIEFKINII